VATTTRNTENVTRTVETMTRTTQESTQIVTDYVARAQELNTGFARAAFETWIDTSRRQAELSQTVARQLFGKTEEQTDAVQALFGEWTGVYADFFAPFAHYRAALQDVMGMPAVTMRNGRLPIAGYDEMSVGEVSDRLDSLTDEELERIRAYERRHKNRDTLIEQLDRKIKASS
jgi:hypothetical protein